MGTWGHGPFENDDASDFLGDLAESSQPADDLRDALTTGALDEGYLEAPEGSMAVAAATVVAITLGGSVDGVSADEAARVSELGLTQSAASELVPDALAALGRVVSAGSELAELWAEGGEAGARRAALDPVSHALLAV